MGFRSLHNNRISHQQRGRQRHGWCARASWRIARLIAAPHSLAADDAIYVMRVILKRPVYRASPYDAHVNVLPRDDAPAGRDDMREIPIYILSRWPSGVAADFIRYLHHGC